MENQTDQTALKTNSDSVVSLVFGIIALVIPVLGFASAIVGIIFSIKSLKTIKQTEEPGKGLSITGLVCSILSILLHIVITIFFFFFIFVAIAAEPTSTTF